MPAPASLLPDAKSSTDRYSDRWRECIIATMTTPRSEPRTDDRAPVDGARSIHEHRLRVRYAETDQMGVVHHANYLLYLEESRTRMMAERGCSYAELEKSGWALPVRRTELRFRAPAYYDEELIVRTHVAGMRGASLTFASDVVRVSDGSLLASGWVELACVDTRNGAHKPALLPEHLRSKLEPRAVE